MFKKKKNTLYHTNLKAAIARGVILGHEWLDHWKRIKILDKVYNKYQILDE